MPQTEKFHPFKTDVSAIKLPKKFTFPFYYIPHPLAIIAANELQEYLQEFQTAHNFGLDEKKGGIIIGKMFGVLVVQTKNKQLGFLAAFSGKLANTNQHDYFVPPVFDLLDGNSFYKGKEQEIMQLTTQIEELEKDNQLQQLQEEINRENELFQSELENVQQQLKTAKKERRTKRKELQEKSQELIEQLNQESIQDKFFLRDFKHFRKFRKFNLQLKIDRYLDKIAQLKKQRKNMSINLQDTIFGNYSFLNNLGKTKSLLRIFENFINEKPPGGAGECAAPKLLQYAYKNELTPIALAEFWWGASPKSEIRKHQRYYPSCKGKCEPILGHMLEGLDVDKNPMLQNPALGKELSIVFEDAHLLVANKPADFLSVPGKHITDSVYTRMQEKHPEATGPLLVHRLDMSTSGLLLVAKSKRIHKALQKQFLERMVKKTYVAKLDGEIEPKFGTIDLPLRVDLEDRPRQLVCEEHGRKAVTEYEVLSTKNGTTRIQFHPITGRTHQLRVHAAHPRGLNAPIIGDDLYGTKAERLHLHAEKLEFVHPITKEKIVVRAESGF